MADKLQITIVGLDIVGCSAGMALRRYQDKLVVTGHDASSSLASQAKSAGAVDRTDWNLISAVEHADRVLLALPLSQIRDTLEAIAPYLQEGCVLVDTANVKAPVLEWGAQLLRPGAHLVGGHPILLLENVEAEKANATLFENRFFCLTPGGTTDSGAVRLAADLVEALGAKPYFMDPTEHDGMMAAIEHTPALMAAALLSTTSHGASWKEMRRLAGSQFFSGSLVLPEDPASAMGAIAANREHVLSRLDQVIAELQTWRGRLAESADEELTSMLTEAVAARDGWIGAFVTGRWEDTGPAPELPTSGTFMRSLIGFGRMKSPNEKKPRR